jgi:hypothetical protein
MGGSFSITCESKESKKRMLGFLQQNFRHWDVVIGKPLKERYVSGITTSLSYTTSEPYKIGFEHGSCWAIMDRVTRPYYKTVLRWAAIQVGKRRPVCTIRESAQRLKFKTPVPYLNADCDQWPILLEKPSDPDLLQWWFDEYGLYRDSAAKANPVLSWEFYSGLLVKARGTQDYHLRPEAQKVIKREVKLVPGYAGNSRIPDIKQDERILLVTTLRRKELDLAFEPIVAEMKRLHKLWVKSV